MISNDKRLLPHPVQQVYREHPAGQSYVKSYVDGYNMGVEHATPPQADTYSSGGRMVDALLRAAVEVVADPDVP